MPVLSAPEKDIALRRLRAEIFPPYDHGYVEERDCHGHAAGSHKHIVDPIIHPGRNAKDEGGRKSVADKGHPDQGIADDVWVRIHQVGERDVTRTRDPETQQPGADAGHDPVVASGHSQPIQPHARGRDQGREQEHGQTHFGLVHPGISGGAPDNVSVRERASPDQSEEGTDKGRQVEQAHRGRREVVRRRREEDRLRVGRDGDPRERRSVLQCREGHGREARQNHKRLPHVGEDGRPRAWRVSDQDQTLTDGLLGDGGIHQPRVMYVAATRRLLSRCGDFGLKRLFVPRDSMIRLPNGRDDGVAAIQNRRAIFGLFAEQQDQDEGDPHEDDTPPKGPSPALRSSNIPCRHGTEEVLQPAMC
jgi:hypothetical protein